jgi:hypothetical protein
MRPRDRRASKGSVNVDPTDAGWDHVAQASWESFPASDSPGWIGRRVDGATIRIHHHQHTDTESGEVAFQDGSFVVDVALLAKLLDLSAPDVQRLMRDGAITSACEKGVGEHDGQYRLTFIHATRRAYVTIDAVGHVLARSVTSQA